MLHTNNALDTNKDVHQIIKNLDHSKVNDHDMISICIISIHIHKFKHIYQKPY